jgi:hypothetical protein
MDGSINSRPLSNPQRAELKDADLNLRALKKRHLDYIEQLPQYSRRYFKCPLPSEHAPGNSTCFICLVDSSFHFLPYSGDTVRLLDTATLTVSEEDEHVLIVDGIGVYRIEEVLETHRSGCACKLIAKRME